MCSSSDGISNIIILLSLTKQAVCNETFKQQCVNHRSADYRATNNNNTDKSY